MLKNYPTLILTNEVKTRKEGRANAQVLRSGLFPAVERGALYGGMRFDESDRNDKGDGNTKPQLVSHALCARWCNKDPLMLEPFP